MRLPFLLLTGLLVGWACIPLNTPGVTGNNVYVGNFFFTPVTDTATAEKNDSVTVTFRWTDTTSNIPHNVTWDSVLPPGPALPANSGLVYTGTYAVKLVAAKYFYHCSIHGGATNDFGMDGQVVVLPFGYSPPTASGTPSRQQPPVSAHHSTESRIAARESAAIGPEISTRNELM